MVDYLWAEITIYKGKILEWINLSYEQIIYTILHIYLGATLICFAKHESTASSQIAKICMSKSCWLMWDVFVQKTVQKVQSPGNNNAQRKAPVCQHMKGRRFEGSVFDTFVRPQWDTRWVLVSECKHSFVYNKTSQGPFNYVVSKSDSPATF